MEQALELARRGEGLVEPNPMVGCVIARDGDIVGQGYHQRCGGPHAEVNALEDAGDAARGATLYVTLEPCVHEGKTPPCAPRVTMSGVERVVAAVGDPSPKVSGRGFQTIRDAGIRLDVGLCREPAILLNAPFFKRFGPGLPLVIAKWAMTADGKIATRAGDSRWISGDESRRRVHRLRGRVDAVMVGGGTARSDDPLLTCRDAERRRTATRVVLCGNRCPAPSSRLVQTAEEAPVLLIAASGEQPEGLAEARQAGCEVAEVRPDENNPGRPDTRAALELLGERDVSRVLVEGGGQLLGSLFDADLVDRVMAFVSPVVAGGADAVSPVGGHGAENIAGSAELQEVGVELSGRDVLMQGWVHDPVEWAPSPDA
jgi:diaminohydroxyphosphoribosylaminopyrimidine deaminase/5-amino-6-(5-phosphoribosylamino)uracil reductase